VTVFGTGDAATAAEVRELWAFLHGDVMEAGVRTALRRSLGLCERHTWLYAICEIELWQGHRPFEVCIVYDDLLGSVEQRLLGRLSRFAAVPKLLRARGPCLICRAVAASAAVAATGAALTGYANFDSVALAAEMNAGTHTVRWLRQTRREWLPVTCPDCRVDAGVDAAAVANGTAVEDAAMRCRRHLLTSERRLDRRVLASQLRPERQLLRAFSLSMTEAGRQPTAPEQASWVVTLAWFAGWKVPLQVAGFD
jgi:hypothetical protein